jgi:hypothetical protein
MVVAAGAVNAQAGGLVGGATNTVKNTAGGATSGVKDTVGNTVKDTTGTVKDTTGTVKDTAGNAVGTVTGSGGGGGSSSTTPTGTTPPPSGGGGSGTGTTGTGATGGSGSTGGAAGPGGRRGSGGNVRGGGHGRNGGTTMPRHPMAIPSAPQQKPNGVPTPANPSLSIATPNPSPFGGASNFMIGQFEIPPFLLPIYQACGSQYGIPWEVLASINKIETAFGTNMGPSTAGAEGWMQFMPATWRTWGIDANGDGRADPYNPVDAICSASRYLQASGGAANLRQAIFAYNHASWYVDEVLAAAQQYGSLPDDLVGSLTGLTAGDQFPIDAKSRYAEPTGRSPIYAAKGGGATGTRNAFANFGRGPVRLNSGVNMSVGQEPQIREALSALAAEIGKPVYVISGYRSPAHSVAVGGFADDPHTKGIAADIGVGAPTRDSVASVSDAQLRAVGLFRPYSAPSEINHVQLLYGAASTSGSAQGINIFASEGAPVVAVNDGTIRAMGHTKSLGDYIVLQDDYGNKFIYWQLGSIRSSKKQASAKSKQHGSKSSKSSKAKRGDSKSAAKPAVSGSQPNRRRLYALPQRPHNTSRASLLGQVRPSLLTAASNHVGLGNHARPGQAAAGELHRGSRVSAGTVLGRVGKTDGLAPHINFAIQPTGIGNGSVDPKPILDGWQLLHETAAYSAGQNPLRNVAKPSDAINDLLMPSSALADRALSDPRLEIYRCGRMDIRSGQIDRRVLATMSFLADNGFRLSIASLRCDAHKHGSSKSQIAKQHSSGDAMAISKVDGLPVAGHQGPGTPAEALIKTVLGQQGVMEPDQITSHEDLPGPISSSVSGKRGDRIDIGFTPLTGSGYQSPFVHAIKGRIDQGVDYVGQGPINAIGNARILRVGAPGWPNGGAGPAGQGVLYKLLDGPQQGSIVFVYEGITPTVKAGEEVVAGQQIATFYPGSSIEIGFADSAGVPLAHDHYTEGKVTGWGRKMDDFLTSVGAPGKHADHFTQMLSAEEWNRVMAQIRRISNPTVRPGSSSEPPAQPHTGPSGPTGPSK